MPGGTTLEQIADRLDERLGLDALWLFGSQAAGRATAESDLDLAVLVRRRPAPVELLAVREELSALAGRDVDLVDLERASPARSSATAGSSSTATRRAPGGSSRLSRDGTRTS